MKTLTLAIVLAAGIAAGQPRPAATGAAEIAGQNLPQQPIGANDLIAISVYDAPELTRTVRVGSDGFLRLPMLKQRVEAQGLMPAELETSIAAALRDESLLVDPFVTVTVSEYSSHPISVMGAVKKPLTFQAVGPVTLLEALAKAEGLSPEAGGEILVSRKHDGQALVERVPVRALLDAADPAMNLKLSGGEEVRVPEAGKIYVVGNVKHPGAFTYREGRGTTVLEALALSEGLLPYANKQAFILRREASAGKNEIAVELRQIMDRKSPDVALSPGDVLYVPDAKGTRARLAVLEKVFLVGTGATSALIYAGTR